MSITNRGGSVMVKVVKLGCLLPTISTVDPRASTLTMVLMSAARPLSERRVWHSRNKTPHRFMRRLQEGQAAQGFFRSRHAKAEWYQHGVWLANPSARRNARFSADGENVFRHRTRGSEARRSRWVRAYSIRFLMS